MSVPEGLRKVLTSQPDVMGGRVCFAGTRVPVDILLDYVNSGESLQSFLDGYPGVSREQALVVLAWQDAQTKKAMGLDLAS